MIPCLILAMWDRGRRVANAELAAFYREQAARLARYAFGVADEASRLELMEMAATFQRLAMREEGIAPEAPANSNVDSSGERTG